MKEDTRAGADGSSDQSGSQGNGQQWAHRGGALEVEAPTLGVGRCEVKDLSRGHSGFWLRDQLGAVAISISDKDKEQAVAGRVRGQSMQLRTCVREKVGDS